MSIARIWEIQASKHAALLAAAGGPLTRAEVSRILRVTEDGVHDKSMRREILAVHLGAKWCFPAAQFMDSGQILPGMPQLLRATIDLGVWGTLSFLMTPHADLDQATPLKILSYGGGISTRLHKILLEIEASGFPNRASRTGPT